MLAKYPYKLAPSEVPRWFVYDGCLLRKRADGSVRPVTAMEGGKLFSMVDGERIMAIDIVWCLKYGNWPKFHLTSLAEDPTDLHIDHIFPTRTKRVRFRCYPVDGGLVRHPLAKEGFRTEREARAHWERCARAFYMKDMPYVEALEARERLVYENTLAAKPELAPAPRKVKEHVARVRSTSRPEKPAVAEGQEAVWYQDQWVVVPVACHVSDDQRVRCAAVLKGAKAFRYDAGLGRTVVAA